MSQEILQIMQEMNRNHVETQLALQCAPLIMNIKISNLLILQQEQKSELLELLSETGITAYELFEYGGKIYYLLYRAEGLEEYLELNGIRKILMWAGYRGCGVEKLLERFRERYMEYILGKGEFPHEMGVFLGYPAEDVWGFIRNAGKNFLYSGYWKVYDKLPEKLLLFQQFEIAREAVIEMLSGGYNIRDMVLGKRREPLLCAAV